jgi:hypothetical protein
LQEQEEKKKKVQKEIQNKEAAEAEQLLYLKIHQELNN